MSGHHTTQAQDFNRGDKGRQAQRIMLKSTFAYNLHEVYLDYFNNFLTVERFAEYYGLSTVFAYALIHEAKRLENEG